MDLFEKIDLFEKLAMHLAIEETDGNLEDIDNTNELEPKESIQSRANKLKSLLKR